MNDSNDNQLRKIEDCIGRILTGRQVVVNFNFLDSAAARASVDVLGNSTLDAISSGESSDETAIKRMYDEALAAFKKGDLATVLSHWEDDGAYLWPAVPPAIGKAEIRDAYESFFSRWTADETFYRHELIVSGDLAYSRFGTELTLRDKLTGNSSSMTLQGVHVYRRRANGWKFQAVIAINVPAETS